jgi:hypothetical protein
MIVSLSGALSSIQFQRLQSNLASEWDSVKASINDPHLARYLKNTEKKIENIKSCSDFYRFIRTYDHYFKKLASVCILGLMVSHALKFT